VDVAGTPRNLNPIVRDEIYQIAVEIQYDDPQFRLWIQDDGKGFDQRVLWGSARAGHFGLRGMNERARLVGGQLDVWSEIDSGTEVELIIPNSSAYAKSPATFRSWLSATFFPERHRE
jgi:nitrate/nitrite-specific signal transduction histidine kinase